MIAADAPIKVAWVKLDQIRMDDQAIDDHQVQFYTSMLQGHDGHLGSGHACALRPDGQGFGSPAHPQC